MVTFPRRRQSIAECHYATHAKKGVNVQRFDSVWERAFAGELCWVDPDGRPAAVPVVPLALDGAPAAALPYARAAALAALRQPVEAAFTVTDARSLPPGHRGAAAYGTAVVTDDVDGALFTAKLLDQELAKYPPSRRLADSALLRREHWWWLPRVVVQLWRRTGTGELPARDVPARAEGLLVRDEPAGLRLDVVAAGDWDGDPVRLRAAEPVRGDGAPALVFGHDYTQPDLERWEVWTRRGPLRGAELTVHEATGAPGGPLPPLDLRARLRAHRALERACRQGISAAERHPRS